MRRRGVEKTKRPGVEELRKQEVTLGICGDILGIRGDIFGIRWYIFGIRGYIFGDNSDMVFRTALIQSNKRTHRWPYGPFFFNFVYSFEFYWLQICTHGDSLRTNPAMVTRRMRIAELSFQSLHRSSRSCHNCYRAVGTSFGHNIATRQRRESSDHN